MEDEKFCVCHCDNLISTCSAFKIKCSFCKKFYHGKCCNVSPYMEVDILSFCCPVCQSNLSINETIIWRMQKNTHRSDIYDVLGEHKPVQSGSPHFVQELKFRHFDDGLKVVSELTKDQFTEEYLIKTGFRTPIVVRSLTGLGMKMPDPKTFNMDTVLQYVGNKTMVDVIDVYRQVSIPVPFVDYIQYMKSKNKIRILNLLSLEFSRTKLNNVVRGPAVVESLDWVEKYWSDNEHGTPKPFVGKYCLIGPENAYTDFHIDLSGSSVWYHVLKGHKIFYLIKPTPANLLLYTQWQNSTNQLDKFFADQVDNCYKLSVRAGDTLLIPSGWIHAVLTAAESLVFGGNFLHDLSIGMQLEIYNLEIKTNIMPRFRFPSFETINWYAAKYLCDVLQEMNSNCKSEIPSYLIHGLKQLLVALRSWKSDIDYFKMSREPVPAMVNATKLLKDMAKEIRSVEKVNLSKTPPAQERKSKRLIKKPVDNDFVDYTAPGFKLCTNPNSKQKKNGKQGSLDFGASLSGEPSSADSFSSFQSNVDPSDNLTNRQIVTNSSEPPPYNMDFSGLNSVGYGTVSASDINPFQVAPQSIGFDLQNSRMCEPPTYGPDTSLNNMSLNYTPTPLNRTSTSAKSYTPLSHAAMPQTPGDPITPNSLSLDSGNQNSSPRLTALLTSPLSSIKPRTLPMASTPKDSPAVKRIKLTLPKSVVTSHLSSSFNQPSPDVFSPNEPFTNISNRNPASFAQNHQEPSNNWQPTENVYVPTLNKEYKLSNDLASKLNIPQYYGDVGNNSDSNSSMKNPYSNAKANKTKSALKDQNSAKNLDNFDNPNESGSNFLTSSTTWASSLKAGETEMTSKLTLKIYREKKQIKTKKSQSKMEAAPRKMDDSKGVYDFSDNSLDSDDNKLTIIERKLPTKKQNIFRKGPGDSISSGRILSDNTMISTSSDTFLNKEISNFDFSSSMQSNKIADLLNASCYLPDSITSVTRGNASPSTSDAIDGMLSIGQSLSSVNAASHLTKNARIQRTKKITKPLTEDEFYDICKKVHTDQEFVYSSLVNDEDDDDDENKKTDTAKDETWSPKGKIQKPVPKMNRPIREKKKAYFHKFLEDAAKNQTVHSSKFQPPKKRKKLLVKKPLISKEKLLDLSSIPSCSHSMPSTLINKPKIIPSSTSAPAVKRLKKGMATAKQRLGGTLYPDDISRLPDGARKLIRPTDNSCALYQDSGSFQSTESEKTV